MKKVFKGILIVAGALLCIVDAMCSLSAAAVLLSKLGKNED